MHIDLSYIKDLGDEVIQEVQDLKEYDGLEEEDKNTLFFLVHRKSVLYREIQVAYLRKDQKKLDAIIEERKDLSSIEASLAVISQLNINERLESIAKEKALQGLKAAVKILAIL